MLTNRSISTCVPGATKGDLNIRWAFVRMAANGVIARGVVLTGAGMLETGWLWLDAIVRSVTVALGTPIVLVFLLFLLNYKRHHA